MFRILSLFIDDLAALYSSYVFAHAVEAWMQIWAEGRPGLNPGQNAIAEHYIFPAQIEVLQEFEDDWPYINVSSLERTLNEHEAGERCFSEMTGEMVMLWDEAASEAQVVEFFDW